MAASLADVLQELQASSGLGMAAVVSADGLVIESASNGDVDVESLCSVASNGALVMEALGQELGETSSEMMTIEYGNHIVMMSSLDQENMLVLLAGPGINLGRMRIVLRRRAAALAEALERE
ncbi:MAG TPA: roadblock/LC7 domain-containing protein [Thermomicrobiales bacterium]|nr:roadblock/LC7 domain-containing protein [Thermomicrobiales bacterium]